MPSDTTYRKAIVTACFVLHVIICTYVNGIAYFEHLQFSTKHVFAIPAKSILSVSLERCAEQCSNRKACKGFSYSTRLTLCVLKIVQNDIPNVTIELEQAAGFVFAKKILREVRMFCFYLLCMANVNHVIDLCVYMYERMWSNAILYYCVKIFNLIKSDSNINLRNIIYRQTTTPPWTKNLLKSLIEN